MKKVCIVATSLGKGGAERSSAILSQMLDKLQYEVHIVIIKNDVDYECSGTLFNLEQSYGSDLSHVKKLTVLRSYFKKHNFDVVIDNRTRPVFFKEYILYNFVFKAKKKISVVRSFFLRTYFPDNRFLGRLLYKNKSTIVAVSKAIKNAVVERYGLDNTKLIYNAVEVDAVAAKADEKTNLDENFILWYGRIEESVKNFTLLLTAYKKSTLPNKNIKLCIIGEGKDLVLLKEHIKDLQIEDKVIIKPFLKNPFPLVKKALFTTLTSRYEGFPRVLIESLACGTPLVSVDCKSGPKEIVQHGYNGLLVQNNNKEALANAFDVMVNDKELYNTCKANAQQSVKKFSEKIIAKQWDVLLKTLLEN